MDKKRFPKVKDSMVPYSVEGKVEILLMEEGREKKIVYIEGRRREIVKNWRGGKEEEGRWGYRFRWGTSNPRLISGQTGIRSKKEERRRGEKEEHIECAQSDTRGITWRGRWEQ